MQKIVLELSTNDWILENGTKTCWWRRFVNFDFSFENLLRECVDFEFVKYQNGENFKILLLKYHTLLDDFFEPSLHSWKLFYKITKFVSENVLLWKSCFISYFWFLWMIQIGSVTLITMNDKKYNMSFTL